MQQALLMAKTGGEAAKNLVPALSQAQALAQGGSPAQAPTQATPAAQTMAPPPAAPKPVA